MNLSNYLDELFTLAFLFFNVNLYKVQTIPIFTFRHYCGTF